MNDLSIRRAEPRDAGYAARLVHESFRPEDLSLTIYGCSGIGNYLGQRFGCPANISPVHSFVAENVGKLIGFVDLLVNASGIFLNYVVTAGQYQGRGVGTFLLRESLARIGTVTGTPMTLDVFAHNSGARAWYRKLGFQQSHSSAHWKGRLGSAAEPESRFEVLNWPESEACQKAFGFSNLTFLEGGETFTVGRLGSDWLKINDSRLVRKPAMLRRLLKLYPGRELLITGTGTESFTDVPIELEVLLRSDRMRTTLPLAL